MTAADTTSGAANGPKRRIAFAIVPSVIIVVVAVVYFFTVLSGDDTVDGPGPTRIDVSDVSTERLESILEASKGDPGSAAEVPGLTLVLAERYFADGSYDRAFPLYAEVVENSNTRPQQFSVSLSRIAWIAWLSTGDTAQALETVDRALRVDPDNSETYYIKAQILWCGAGDAQGAVVLFENVLRAGDLTGEVRSQVTGDLEAARAGKSCR
jgi:tetratricopeptide (TPR) repeat protein